jgi:hypothetical protein
VGRVGYVPAFFDGTPAWGAVASLTPFVKTLQKAAENPESENMRVGLKKILASRLFGVLTMLPTPRLQLDYLFLIHRVNL